MKDYIDKETDKYYLPKDKFVVIKNALELNEINILKNYCNNNNYSTCKTLLINNNLKNIIHRETKNINYIFQDYIWIIKESSVHTCHSDNNKVTHKDDIKHIYYYQNFNKVLNKDNKLPFIIKIQKNVYCMFPIISNLTQNDNIRSSRRY
jgi:hypothetical protein